MSLVSASGIITGTKEYVYRGIQHLPIVMASTSLLFTITTGSIAHMNLFLGLGIFMPLYTFILQSILGSVMPLITTNSISWRRSTGDTCDLVASRERVKIGEYMENTNAIVPSYWITSVGFFFGYAISNIVDSFNHPAAEGASDVNKERRNHHSMFIAINISVFFLILFGTRMWYMKSCDGLGALGLVLSYLFAALAFWLGYGTYSVSKSCGARSTDLFGVLSQLLPNSAGASNPIVCKAE
jgi:hypothetical protein